MKATEDESLALALFVGVVLLLWAVHDIKERADVG